MVHPSSEEVACLKAVAREIRETAEAFGYRVGVAVGQHPSFSHTRTPASWLERNLVLDAARRGASVAGLGIDDASGGLDLIAMTADVVRRYRVKRVNLTAAGSYDVVCGLGSTLLVQDPESLFREEKWIFGYVSSDDHTVDRIIAAPILDWRGDGPVHLVLGAAINLSTDQPPRGFTSTNEDLPGFETDDSEEDDGTADAA